MRKLSVALLLNAFLATRLSAQQYFPAGSLSSNPKMDEFRSDWYSQELKVLKEPPLWRPSQQNDETVYSFLWLRAFHDPLCVSLSIHSHSASLVFKEGKAHGAAQTGRLIGTKSLEITQTQANAFLSRIAELRFWSVLLPDSALSGPDGSDWILEATSRGAYKVVTVYAPSEGNPIRVLGLMLLFDLAKIKIPSNAIY